MENEELIQKRIEEKENDNYYGFQHRFYGQEEVISHKVTNKSPRAFGEKLAASLMERIDRDVTKVE